METVSQVIGAHSTTFQRLVSVREEQHRRATCVEVTAVGGDSVDYLVHLANGEYERLRDKVDDFIQCAVKPAPSGVGCKVLSNSVFPASGYSE
jgi:hypothetical protein